MSLTQAEADRLLQVAKHAVEPEPFDFSRTQPMDYKRELRSADRREQFYLDVERGVRRRVRLRYQTRARKVVVLARLDIEGARHVNPPGSPHRPGEDLGHTHLHLYREGFENRVAFQLEDVAGWRVPLSSDDLLAFEEFLRYCHVVCPPGIQMAI